MVMLTVGDQNDRRRPDHGRGRRGAETRSSAYRHDRPSRGENHIAGADRSAASGPGAVWMPGAPVMKSMIGRERGAVLRSVTTPASPGVGEGGAGGGGRAPFHAASRAREAPGEDHRPLRRRMPRRLCDRLRAGARRATAADEAGGVDRRSARRALPHYGIKSQIDGPMGAVCDDPGRAQDRLARGVRRSGLIVPLV